MSNSSHSPLAVHVSAAFFGSVVEDTFVRRGARQLQIGNSDRLAVPVPEGMPYAARIAWRGPTAVRIVDGAGRAWLLSDVDDVVRVEVGPVTLTFRLVRRFHLRRTHDVDWRAAVAWFSIVFAATLVVAQLELLWDKRCSWFGLDCQVETVGMSTGGAGGVTAEYLARLLRQDHDGAEDGVIERSERETFEKKKPSFYMPAGNTGPITDMGGAANTAPEPERAPAPKEEEPELKTSGSSPKVQAVDVGSPVPEAKTIDPAPGEASDDPLATTREVEEQPAEEKEGWGVPDWYDATDKAIEELEIEVMLKASRDKLKIDPNDPQALSILSYYQYLAEDFSGAERTYERYIGLYPEESAGYNNKALIYKRRGEYDKEEGLYRQALALTPSDVTALNNLAVCLAHKGRYDEALAIMDELETLDAGNPYADLHRSKIHAANGEEERAFEYLEKALQGMERLDTLHHIEFRQDIRVDPAFANLRKTARFRAILWRYYGSDSPVQE